MRIFTITAIALILSINVWSQSINPIKRKIGELNISIDPRIELLSAIQVLSNYPYIDRKSAYSKDTYKYFSSFKSLNAVQMTDKYSSNGFVLDAPVKFMLYLSPVPELKAQSTFSDYLLKRGGNLENLDKYRFSIEQFAIESNFSKFWRSNEKFYNNVLDLTISEIGEEDLIKIIEDYYNIKQNSYNIIISTLFYGSYASKILASNNKYDIYSCSAISAFKDSVPYIGRNNFLRTVVHEFGHSFVNPETEKHSDKVSSCSSLFNPIRNEMAKMGYGNWSSCINEHIVRAINVRFHQLHRDSIQAARLLNEEKANNFIYIEPILAKLKEYEKARDSKNITFSDFYPQLLYLFDSLQKHSELEDTID